MIASRTGERKKRNASTVSARESPAFEALGYKQLIFEPFFGGGMVTALAVPIIYLTGIWPLFFAMLVIFSIAVGVGLLYYAPRATAEREQAREGNSAVAT